MDAEKLKKFKANLDLLRDFIKPTGFVAGTPYPTIADYSILGAYGTYTGTDKFFVDFEEYPELKEWAARLAKTIPNYEHNVVRGEKIFVEFWQNKLKQAK